MKGRIKRAASLWMAFLLVFALLANVGAAWAAPGAPDGSKNCSIIVTDVEGVLAGTSNIVVDLYYIADWDYDSIAFLPVEPYTGMEFTGVDKDAWLKLAQQVSEIALSEGSIGNCDYTFGTNVQQTGVRQGLYLVVLHNDGAENYVRNDNGEIYTIGDSETEDFKFTPWLVSLPHLNDESTAWVYDTTLSTKMGHTQKTGDNGVITIEKIDADDPTKFLPGAEFELYAAAPENDNGDTLEVYVEGMGKVTLYRQMATGTYADGFGNYVTDADGKIKINKPDVPPYTLFALKEVVAPDGYELLKEPYYFYLEDMTVWDEPVGGDRGVSATNWNDGLVWTGSDTVGLKTYNTFAVNNTSDYDVYVRVKIISEDMNSSADDSGFWPWPNEMGDEYRYFMGYEDSNYILKSGETTTEFKVVAGAIVEYELCKVEYDNYYGGALPMDWNNPDLAMEDLAKIAGAYTSTAHLLTNNGTITIENSPLVDVDLPSVGGMGTTVFYIAGTMLLAGALLPLFHRKRKFEFDR